MKNLIVAALAIPALAACADDAAPIVRIGLYKNGLAVVTRTVTPDSTGTAVVDGSARPAYGTFWHSSEKPVTVTRTAAREGVTISFRAAPNAAAYGASWRRLAARRGQSEPCTEWATGTWVLVNPDWIPTTSRSRPCSNGNS